MIACRRRSASALLIARSPSGSTYTGSFCSAAAARSTAPWPRAARSGGEHDGQDEQEGSRYAWSRPPHDDRLASSAYGSPHPCSPGSFPAWSRRVRESARHVADHGSTLRARALVRHPRGVEAGPHPRGADGRARAAPGPDRAAAGLPAEAIRALTPLQGQHAPAPFLALAARLEGFSRADLEAAIGAGAVVKSTLMRLTLHLARPPNYPAYHQLSRQARMRTWRKTYPHLDEERGHRGADGMVRGAARQRRDPRAGRRLRGRPGRHVERR